MLLVRSYLFTLLFYLSNAVQMIFWAPAFFIVPREDAWKIARLWAYSHLWLQHKICGSRYAFRGLENIPDGSILVAAKHQSAWETYTMVLFFADASFVLKRELMYIPLFGWYAAKMKVVPVNRGKRSRALAEMTRRAAANLAERPRQLIIYPEGTRKKPGDIPQYKYGIVHLYRGLNVPVLPIAVNSGLFWGRRSLRVYPGTIVMEFLPPIEPGLGKAAFAEKLQTVIEAASDRLIAEAAAAKTPPPLAREIMQRRAVAGDNGARSETV